MNEWNDSDDINDDFLLLKKIPKSACTRFARCHFLRSKCERKMEASILQRQFTCCFVDCSVLCTITTAVLSTFSTKKTYVFEDFTVQCVNGICVSVATQRRSRSWSEAYTADYKGREAMMWEKGVLGDSTLQTLVRSVFFLNGKNFWTYSEWSRELCEVLGVFNMCIFVQCYNMQFSLYTCRKMFSCEN